MSKNTTQGRNVKSLGNTESIKGVNQSININIKVPSLANSRILTKEQYMPH